MTPVSLLASMTVIKHVKGLTSDIISCTSTQPVFDTGTTVTSVKQIASHFKRSQKVSCNKTMHVTENSFKLLFRLHMSPINNIDL